MEQSICRPPRCSLHLEEVCRILGRRPTKLYEDIRAGLVPAPYRIAVRAVRWDSEEIYDTLDKIKAEGRNAWLQANKTPGLPINPKLRKTNKTIESADAQGSLLSSGARKS